MTAPSLYSRPVLPRADKALGYLYFMDKAHPLADKKGRVWHHRHVASLSLGRWLTAEEHVHHKDEDRSNNTPENLEVVSYEQHGDRHRKIKNRPCEHCSRSFRPLKNKGKYCSPQCADLSLRRFEVTKEQLLFLLETESVTSIAKRYGVTDNAVKKRCKKFGISWPKHHPRGRSCI